MAATPFDAATPAANLFDIYNDAARNLQPLPAGNCNFVDLTPGANGAKCGCRRFWPRSAPGSPVLDPTSGWCMCNHHACYHDEGPRDGPAAEPNAAGQENERPPRTGREPLSPVVDISLKVPSAVPGLHLPNLGGADALSFLHDLPDGSASSFRMPSSQRPDASMPDTLSWGDFVQSQPGAHTLPPIPSQCLMPSQTASAASSVRAKYLRPFAGKGLQTLSGAGGPHSRSPLRQQPKDQATVAASPDPTAALGGSFVLVDQDHHGTAASRPGTAIQEELPSVPLQTFKNLSDAVNGHEQRLDRLETVSFSAVGHDECHEKHDHLDLRVTELESRFEDVEKLVNDNGSVVNRRTDRDDGTAHSVVSGSTSMTSRPAYSEELYSQVQALQAQVTHLQYSLPSSSHAWEVEVVFLPFPLKKVWQDITQFRSDQSLSSDDWTQLPMTHSAATLRSQSPFYGDWATADHDAEWLLPRACGDRSITDRRLRSRGMIQTVSVRGPDARSVQRAMQSAFADVFRQMMQPPAQALAADPRLSRYMGLQSTWVPLRKIHKDSRLRFLSPAEMLTPAMWDVQFLNSVMMRSSEPRLFVTHPDAYLQDYRAYETGWTWQRLREMSRVYPEPEESQEVPEADAMEDYWSWNEQLDEAPSAHTSMSMRNDRQRVSISPSVQYFPAVQSRSSASPVLARGQSPLLKGRRGSRPPHIRTASVPIAPAGNHSPAASKRRVASYGQSRRSSPSVRLPSQAAIMKRRHTRSPSHQRFTPRWTSSPSPMPLGLNERQPVRGTTPFAYATPYSNAPPLQEVRPVRSGSAAPRAAPEYRSDGESGGMDEDYEIQIYESGSDAYDDDDDDDESLESAEVVTHAQPDPAAAVVHDTLYMPLPEDEPWPGIEDRGHLSDRENIDPHRQQQQQQEQQEPHVADGRSDASSQPSEYPSTQRAWPEDTTGFHIHEDDEPRA